MLSALVATVHHLAAFTLVAALAAEHVVFDRNRADPRLQALDVLYGASAGVLLAAGFARVYFLEKGADYYLANPYFQAKLGLFAVLGLLSVYPTVTFIRWRRRPQVSPAQAKWLPWLLRAQLVLVPAILACAVLMAKGFE